MKKYIDTDALYEKIHNIGGCDALPETWAEGWDKAIDGCLNLLESMLAADVQEVRHGEWMYNDLYFPSCAECSECGWKSSVGGEEIPSYHYCPRCGARMDGG